MSRSRNILVLFTGSIACYKACEVVSQLVQRGHRVRVAASRAALQFVGVATLEGLTRQSVHSDIFAPGGALEHIDLTRWADLTLVCPATANTLNAAAAGLSSELPTALLLAHDRAKPLLFAPAMNPAMWAHPATVVAVEKLRTWGAQFIPVGVGRTACGEVGDGRLAEPDDIVSAVEAALAPPAGALRVLVTGGGTSEPLDGVRVLTNRSTGRTAVDLASHLARTGHEVTLLRAVTAAHSAAEDGVTEATFETFADLQAALKNQLGTGAFDVVIHAAAVSDFGIERIESCGRVVSAGGKLDSETPPVLHLKKHPKLVDGLRAMSPRPLRVVAFKLTHGADASAAKQAVAGLFAHSQADLVVHNDTGARAADLPATIYRPDGSVAVHCASRADLAPALEKLIRNLAPSSP